MDKNIRIYTDGACRGNPGPGGWGAILIYESNRKEIYGGSLLTTNNIMELRAVIEALKIIKFSSKIIVTTDSKYVKDGITKWIFNWKQKNWKTASKKSVKNKDLWIELDRQVFCGCTLAIRWSNFVCNVLIECEECRVSSKLLARNCLYSYIRVVTLNSKLEHVNISQGFNAVLL